ncbi:MAG: hypothetical protein RLZZ511_1984 [Cyanobacteriota bacterium]|jgi:hypothetical protein
MKAQDFRHLILGTFTAAVVLGTSIVASAAPSADFRGGRTSVTLSQDFVGALTALKVTPGTIGNGRLKQGVASFPIVSGAGDLGAVKLEVNHAGGLSLTAGKTIVELTDYSITNLDGKLVLTGLVKANDNLVGRIPLFDLALSGAPKTATVHSGLQVTVSDVKVTLSKPAAEALNGVFQVTAFKEGLKIGTAKVRGFAK